MLAICAVILLLYLRISKGTSEETAGDNKAQFPAPEVTSLTEGSSDCVFDDDATNKPLEDCLSEGKWFLANYVDAIRKQQAEEHFTFNLCWNYAAFRSCISRFLQRCPVLPEVVELHWKPLVKHLSCVCHHRTHISNEAEAKKNCTLVHNCLESEFGGPLVKRCDVMYRFNRRQKTRGKCYFLNEALLCKRSLVSTACGAQTGNLAFHLAKLNSMEQLEKSSCFVNQHQDYTGFSYTENCTSKFVQRINDCALNHFNETMLVFDNTNELVSFGTKKTVKKACRDFQAYRRCLKPIEEDCPQGMRLIIDYVAEIRRYVMKMDIVCQTDNQHLATYIDNLPCFHGMIRNRTLNQCSVTWKGLRLTLDGLTAYEFYCTPDEPLIQEIKRDLRGLRSCYTNTYNASCGSEAASLMDKLMAEAFDDPAILKLDYRPDCLLHNASSHAEANNDSTGRMGGAYDRPSHRWSTPSQWEKTSRGREASDKAAGLVGAGEKAPQKARESKQKLLENKEWSENKERWQSAEMRSQCSLVFVSLYLTWTSLFVTLMSPYS